MAIYNVTNFIKANDEHDTLNTVKQRYNLSKIQVLFSDWSLEFGIKTQPKQALTNEQKRAIIKLLDKRTGMDSSTPIRVLTTFPQIVFKTK